MKEYRAQGSSDWKHSEAKGQKKEKTLTLCSNLEVEGDGVGVDEVGDY
jgi:hypothetical protein